MKGTVTEALESNKAFGKLQGTLDNLGKGEAFDRLSKKAEDMAKRFKFLDTPDVVGVFDQLITYGKLTEAQIDSLTPVIINFSAKSKTSLSESASIIIKALEGNGKTLKEYGINIKDAKTESERLAIVMNDLGGKVNGAADAFGQTAAGKIAETKQNIKDLKEEIGTAFLPLIQKTFEGIKNLVDGARQFFEFNSRSFKDLQKQMSEKPGQDVANFAESISTEMGQKTIADQKKLAESYKQIYITSQNALSDFLKSSNKDNLDERNKLLARQEQDEKIYLSTQRTLQEAISVDKNNRMRDDKAAAKKAAEDAEKKRLDALKKAKEEYAQLLKMWEELRDRINSPYALVGDDPVLSGFRKAAEQAKKDTDAVKLLYDKRVINHQTYSDEIVRIEAIRQKQLEDILKKNKGKQSDITVDPNNLSLAKPLVSNKAIETKNANDNKDFQLSRERVLQDNLAKYQLDAIKSTGKKKLDADLAVLDLQEAQELASKDHTENQKLLIEEQFRQKRAEAEKNHILATAQTVLDIANSVANLFAILDSNLQADDQAKLDQNQKSYDDDKKKLDRNLQGKIVSQKEYDRQLNALDEKKRKADAAIKLKDFKASQRQQEIQAIMR